MSRIESYSLYSQSFIQSKTNPDEILKDKYQKNSSSVSLNSESASAVYEPSGNPVQKAVTYAKPSAAVSRSTDSDVQLSDAAKALLEELKEKYSNADIIIADYSSDEEADRLMSQGDKEFSILIEPEMLEKMAADEDLKDQCMSQIDTAMGQADEIFEELGEDADKVESIGITFKSDGTVSYFAKMAEESQERSEEIKEELDEKRQEKKAEEKKSLKADSLEELLEKIKNSISAAKSEQEES